MHVCIVTHSLPLPNSNGGPMTVWGLLQKMKEHGWIVSLVCLKYSYDVYFSENDFKKVHDLDLNNFQIIDLSANTEQTQIPLRLRFYERALKSIGRRLGYSYKRYSFEDIFNASKHEDVVGSILKKLDPNAIFCYHWDSFASFARVYNERPVLLATGDAWQEPRINRWKQLPFWEKLRGWKNALDLYIWSKDTKRMTLWLARKAAVFGTFQHHHTETLRKLRGLENARYFRTALVDSMIQENTNPTQFIFRKSKTVFLLGPSSLQSTTTQAGLNFFATKVYPLFQKFAENRDYEIRVVGEGVPPNSMAKIIDGKKVKQIGRVDPPNKEFLTANAQLVCTPFIMGNRVRIITAMSFGCPVITMKYDAANIPELKDQENCLIAQNARAFATYMIEFMDNPTLQDSLRKSARTTYEAFFGMENAANELCKEILEMSKC